MGGRFAQLYGVVDKAQVLSKHRVLMIGIADVGMRVADQVDSLDFWHEGFPSGSAWRRGA